MRLWSNLGVEYFMRYCFWRFWTTWTDRKYTLVQLRYKYRFNLVDIEVLENETTSRGMVKGDRWA